MNFSSFKNVSSSSAAAVADDTDFSSSSAKTYGTKSKAPVVIDGAKLSNTTSASIQQLQQQRKAVRDEAAAHTTPSGYNPVSTELAKTKETKTAARIFFKQRNLTKLPKSINNWNSVARVLDLRLSTTANTFYDPEDATPQNRILLYSRTHKCSHGRHFNDWRVDNSVVMPLCDHEYETATKEAGPRCENCGRQTFYYTRICGCKPFVCTRCFSAFYPHRYVLKSEYFEDSVSTIYKNYDEHRGKMFPFILSSKKSFPTTMAPWASTPQGGMVSTASSFVVNTAKAAFSHIKNVVKVVHDYFSSLLSSAVDSAFFSWLSNNPTLKCVIAFITDFLKFCLTAFSRCSPLYFIDLLLLAQNYPKYALFRFFTPLFNEFYHILYSKYRSLDGKCDWNPYSKGYATRTYNFTTKHHIFQFTHALFTSPDTRSLIISFVDTFRSVFGLVDDELDASVEYNSDEESVKTKFSDPLTSQPGTSSCFESQAGFDFSSSLLRSAVVFSKEILPLFSLANNLTNLIDKLPRLVMKFFSFFTCTTSQWIECELAHPDSPIAQYLDCSYKYWSAFSLEQSKLTGQLHYESKVLSAKAMAHAKAEMRYDTVYIAWHQKIEKIFDHPRVPGTRQNEPFCLRLIGAPGVGKSTSYRALLAPIFGVKTKEEMDNLCFVKGISEYWDGCLGRPVVVFDDFGQDRQDEADIKDMITLVSDAPFMPNFAQLTGSNPKGTTYDPKIVVASSNASIDQAKSLNCDEALRRRFHIVLKVTKNANGERQFTLVIPNQSAAQSGLSQPSVCSYLYNDPYFREANHHFPSSPMNLESAQLFIHKTYDLFLKSRRAGVALMEESYSSVLSPLLDYKDGEWKSLATRCDELMASNTELRKQNSTYQGEDVPILSYSDQHLRNHFNLFLLTHKIHYINYSLLSFDTIFSLVSKFVFIAASIKFLYSFFFPNNLASTPQSSTAKGKIQPAKFIVQASDNLSDMLGVLEKNSISITVGRMTTCGLFVTGTTFLSVEHLFIDKNSPTGDYVPDGSLVILNLPNKEEPVTFPFSRSALVPIIKTSGDCDAVLYTVPDSFVNHHRTILSYFWNGSYAINNRKILATDFDHLKNQTRLENATADSFILANYDVGSREYTQNVAHANYVGRKGQCGSPILDAQVSQAPILGIHVGINNSTGRSIFLLLTRSLIEKHLKDISLDRIVCSPHCSYSFDGTERGASHVRGSMEVVGTLVRPLYTSQDTLLRKSALFDQIQPHTTEPSVLSNSDHRLQITVDLWEKVTTKLSRQMKPPKPSIFEQSQNDMDQMILGMPTAGPVRMLTLHEALNGSLDYPHLKSIDMSTSCGYPWVLEGIKKDQLFTRDSEGLLVPTSKFMKAYDDAWTSVENNTVPDFIMLCSLKDERRPLEKVHAGKTRLFTVAPLVMNVLLKQFFGSYANSLMDNFISVSYAGKVDRLGSSWSTMMMTLFEKSPVGFGADFGSYDGRLEKSRMIRSMKRMTLRIRPTLTPLEHKMLDSLIIATTQPYYAFQQMIVSVPGSLASGIWITQLLGSDMTHTMLYEAWLHSVPCEYKSMYHFKTFVRLRVMGDDHIVAVIPSMTKYYNGTTVCQYFKEHDMEYTSPEKSGDPDPTLPLEQIAFLKNKSGHSWGMITPLMDVQASLEPVNWVRKHEFLTVDQLTEINVNGSLRALFFHGPTLFNEIRDKVLKIKPHYTLLTYGYLRGVFQSYGTFPGCEQGEPSFYDLSQLPTPEPTQLEQYTQWKNMIQSAEKATPHSSDDEFVVIDALGRIKPHTFVEVAERSPETLSTLQPIQPPQPKPRKLLTQDSNAGSAPKPQPPAPTTKMNQTLENFFNAELDKTKRPNPDNSPLRIPESPPSGDIADLVNRTRIYTETTRVAHTLSGSNQMQRLPLTTKHTCQECSAEFNGKNALYAHQYASHTMSMPLNMNLGDTIENLPYEVLRKSVTDLNVMIAQKPLPNEISEFTHYLLDNYGFLYLKPVLHRLNNWLAYINKTITYTEYVHTTKTHPLPTQETPARTFEPQGGDPHSNNPEPTATTVTPSTFVPEQNVVIDDPVNEASSAMNNLGWTNREKNKLEYVTPAGADTRVTSKRAETSLNDIAWSLDKILRKWNQVAVLKWNISDAPGTVVARYDVVRELLTSSVVSMPFTTFEKFRCSAVRFKFMLVGSKFHQGRLLCSFIPTMCPPTMHRGDTSPKTLIEIGGVQLDPSSGSDVEFTIPWNHFKGHLDLVSGDVLGQLHIVVLNQLAAVTGASTSVNLKVLFCLEDPEFKIFRPSVGTFDDVLAARNILHKRQLNSTPQGNDAQESTNISSINNMTQNEALPIAPVRALTSDADVSHFGEKYTTLRDIGKRYRIAEFNVNTHSRDSESMPIVFAFKVADILRYRFPEIHSFKTLRGGMNFKIVANVSHTDASVQTKHVMLITANSTASYTQTFEGSNIFFEYHNTDFVNPLSRSDDTSASEFYVPFLQHSSTCLQPLSIELPGTSTSNLLAEYSVTPEILIHIWPASNLLKFHIVLEIYAALSDEFAAGAFIGTRIQACKNHPGTGFSTQTLDEPTAKTSILKIPRIVDSTPQGLEDMLQPLMARVIPENIISDALGALLDKPEISTPPVLYKSRKTDFLSHAVGPQMIEKLQLYPSAQQTTDPEHFCSPRDEMDFRFHLKNRRSLIGTVAWKDTGAVGDILFSGLIGPFGFVTNPVPEKLKLNIIDYFSKYFTFWRGGITLIIDVVTSAYHEGKLEVTYHPNSRTVPATYDSRVSQYVVSSVVKNTENVFGVTFPFLSDTPWKRIYNGFPLNDNSVANPAPNVQDYFLGSFSVTIAAPLRVPSTVSSSVDVNLYVQAADDFDLNIVSMNGAWCRDDLSDN